MTWTEIMPGTHWQNDHGDEVLLVEETGAVYPKADKVLLEVRPMGQRIDPRAVYLFPLLPHESGPFPQAVRDSLDDWFDCFRKIFEREMRERQRVRYEVDRGQDVLGTKTIEATMVLETRAPPEFKVGQQVWVRCEVQQVGAPTEYPVRVMVENPAGIPFRIWLHRDLLATHVRPAS